MSVMNEAIRGFIGRTCLQLDDARYTEFLDNCGSAFSYVASTFSPELGMEMVWLEHDRAGFESMINMLPRHVQMEGLFSRQAVVCDIAYDGVSTAKVISRVIVIHTDATGSSRVLAVGRYKDTLEIADGTKVKLQAREVRLDTRDLAQGVHVPL